MKNIQPDFLDNHRWIWICDNLLIEDESGFLRGFVITSELKLLGQLNPG